ncbi:MAG: DUF971 domain-containing protein [Deltaproteobacteria bacterium]|nr:DUF971 domain-containing protein [Deltaproteobacteria bacterium]
MGTQGKLIQPRDIKDDAARREIVIPWTDGHLSRFPYQVLRGWCPCAECQGHGGTLTWQEVPPVGFVKVQPVGLYGAQFTWSDMHGHGIFRFDYLRELCCCEACTKQRGGKPPRPAAAG